MAVGMTLWETVLFLVLMSADVFCLTNSGILIAWLHKSRNQARAIRATYEVMCAVFLVAASIMLILATSLMWPQDESASTAPKVVQIVTLTAFMGAHLGLAVSSHRARRFFMTPGRA